MTARAGLNLAIATYCLRLVCREGAVGAKVGVIAMLLATVADGRTIIALRRVRSTSRLTDWPAACRGTRECAD